MVRAEVAVALICASATFLVSSALLLLIGAGVKKPHLPEGAAEGVATLTKKNAAYRDARCFALAGVFCFAG